MAMENNHRELKAELQSELAELKESAHKYPQLLEAVNKNQNKLKANSQQQIEELKGELNKWPQLIASVTERQNEIEKQVQGEKSANTTKNSGN